jgi:hypothetical protein
MPIRTRIDPTTAEDSPTAGGPTPAEEARTGGREGRSAGVLRSLTWLAVAAALSTGSASCQQGADRPDPLGPAISAAAVSDQSLAPDVRRGLAALREVTAPYHRFEAARAAGWTVLVPDCRDNQPVGGMGWHYANPAYIDGELDVRKPEALIYEPQKNGSLELVGVEYVVPFSVLPPEAEPPVLFGQQFKHNPGDALWMLHVWAWRNNVDGIFATWNPAVDCRYAS